MNIVYATSDLYSHPALISIKSLLMNNQCADEINIYYVENHISNENKALLFELVKEYGRNLFFVQMPEFNNSIKGLLRTNAIVYSYFFLQDILPSDVDRVLLLESDAIVVNNLQEMYLMDIEDYYIAAADDLQSKWYKRKLHMKDEIPYFNSGIILYNLEKWRNDDITKKIVKILNTGRYKFFYEVQDEMNVLLKGKVKIFSPKYNCTTGIFLFDYKNMMRYRHPSTYCSEKEFEEAKKNPVIIHFTRNQIIQSRPWVEGCMHPFNNYYLEIKKDTVLRDESLWNERRKFINKIALILYKKFPSWFIASLLGIVHSFLYPVVLYRFIMKK